MTTRGIAVGACLIAAGASCGGSERPAPPEEAPAVVADPVGEPGTDPVAADDPVRHPDARPSDDSRLGWVYRCSGGDPFAVRVVADTAHLDLDVRELALPRRARAVGAHYSGDGYTLTMDGPEATLGVPGGAQRRCAGTPVHTVDERARALGFDFRAVGQEPGWLLHVDLDRSSIFLGDYGEIRASLPAPGIRERGDTVWLEVRTDAHALEARVVARVCHDTMSGQPFTHVVDVRFDARTFEGCGVWLEAR